MRVPRSLAVPATLWIFVFLVAFPLSAQETGSISGSAVDRQTSSPIADVVVTVRETGLSTLTDANGRFQIQGVPSGVQFVVMSHVGYGEHIRMVVVEAGREVRLRAEVAATAIELAPVVVEADTELDRRRRTQGHSMNEILRPVVDDAYRRGLGLTDVLRQGMPGLQIRGGRGGPCIEYRVASGSGGFCREVAVVMDGVRISDPATLYATMPLQDIERMELLSPGEAGTMYGEASWGVLLIETRRGPRRLRAASEENMISGFDWSAESEPYRWPKVLGSSLVGNAAGLGLALVAANHCLKVRENGLLGVRSECGPLITMGSGFLALGLPSLGGSMAARWAGSTGRSHGRLVPSAILGTLTAATGYLLVVRAQSGESQTAGTIGTLILTVGSPVLMTLSDRVFRALR